MNALYLLLAAAEETPADPPADAADPGRLILEYVLYAAVIVIGLVLLALLHRKGRLPKHMELKKQLDGFAQELALFSQLYREGKTARLKEFKRAANVLYRADKLIYTITAVAEKERDGDIANIATTLEGVRADMLPCKAGKADRDDAGLDAAAEKTAQAQLLLDKILARDAEIKARRTKKAS